MTGRALLSELGRRDEEILEALPARLGWPFIAEHDLWFHGRLHGPRLRALLARASKLSDAPGLAAAGRLRRLLGDDAGAARDLRAALDLDAGLALARAWLAELDLSGPHAESGLSEALAGGRAPAQALLYRAASRLMRGDLEGALADARAYARRRPRSALAAMLEGEALWRLRRRPAAAAAFTEAASLEPVCAAAWLLRARAEAGGLPKVLPPRAARSAEAAHDADPTYALITLSWHGPRARPGKAWRRHLGRLLRFAFEEPERAGWYYRQDDIHYAPYHFQEYADARALLAIRPRAAWAEALTARGALRCPPDPELARQGLLHARRAARLAPWAGWTRAWVGLGLIKARRGAEAERFFTRCLRLQPLYHRALAWRGALRRGLGLTEGALSDLDRAVSVDELYPFAPHERSLARRSAGDWVGAALDLDRAFKLDWRYCWVFASGRAPSDAELGRGERELDAALRRHPSCVSLRTWRGELRRARGDLSGALSDLHDAAAQDPAHANAQAFLGKALLEAGRAAEAALPLERAVALSGSQWVFRGWLAEALFRGGRRAEAFARLAEIVRGTPQHWWALHLRASFELELGRPARALADIRLADSYEGRHADGHHLAARACLALGRLAEAEAEADKALRVSPHLGRALLLRAEIRRRRGRTESSLADWRSVLERFPYLLNEEERARARALLAA